MADLTPDTPDNSLPANIRMRFDLRRTDASLFPDYVRNLSDFLAAIDGQITPQGRSWFRGHGDIQWQLTPSVLRYQTTPARDAALDLLREFKRVAETKLPSVPSAEDGLRWVQTAQHYGLPTRLLDWTKSPTIALYFACQEPQKDGLVFVLDPQSLNRMANPRCPRVFDPHKDASKIKPYLRLKGAKYKKIRKTIAIDPIWDSERILIQRGCFTLHGTPHFELTSKQAPSLACLAIPKESKRKLLDMLAGIGVDEMSLFPTLEHVCSHLKRAHLAEEV